MWKHTSDMSDHVTSCHELSTIAVSSFSLSVGLPEYEAGDVCLHVLVSFVCFPALLLSAALSAVS